VSCSASRVVPGAHRVVGPGTHRCSGPREVHTTAGPINRTGDTLSLPQAGVDGSRISLPLRLHQQTETNGGFNLVVTELPIGGVWGGALVAKELCL
jgi:hypothetical protein